VYPSLSPGTPNRATLATRCADGDLRAGAQLADVLWKDGIVTVDTFIREAATAVTLTPVVFDRLCDAFQVAALARYMREHGIKDPRPEPIESD